MNLKSLEALRAFIETGSLTDAAERLHRTQPQVSRLLAALEEEVGFSLFSRKSRRLVLTAEAREFYSQVERSLASMDEVTYVAQRIREQQRDHVRILIAPHVTDALIADAVALMTHKTPGFTASIDSRSRIDIELWLNKELFDLGVTVLPLDDPAIDIEPFMDVEAVAVMAEDHPLAQHRAVRLEDISAFPLVLTSARSVLRQCLDAAFSKIKVTPQIKFETPNGLIACQLAARGIGVTVADGLIAHSSLRPGMIVRQFKPAIRMRYAFLFPKWQPRSASVSRLASLIRECAQEITVHVNCLRFPRSTIE